MNFVIPFKRQVPGISFQSHSANLAAKGMCSKQFFNQSLLQSELKNMSTKQITSTIRAEQKSVSQSRFYLRNL